MAPTLEDKLNRLLDERDIRELVQTLCRGIDRLNIGCLESVFHEDALDEHGFNPTNTSREYLDAVPVRRPHIQQIQHHITNHVIAVDGDRAEGEAYALAFHRYEDQGSAMIMVMGARYLDKYERRNGTWKIKHRLDVEDWAIVVPAPPQRGDELTGVLKRGGIGQADPGYGFFEILKC